MGKRMEMTTNEALMALVTEAMRDKNTKSGYRKVCKALEVLQSPPDLRAAILYRMNYTHYDGTPWKWLVESKASGSKSGPQEDK